MKSYKRWTFKDGTLTHEKTETISDEQLINYLGKCDELTFRTLLDQWNRVSVRAQSGILHVYTVEDV